jgi:hypothetical protein
MCPLTILSRTYEYISDEIKSKALGFNHEGTEGSNTPVHCNTEREHGWQTASRKSKISTSNTSPPLSVGFQPFPQNYYFVLLLCAHFLHFSTSDTFNSAAVKRASHDRNTSDKVLIYFFIVKKMVKNGLDGINHA